MGLSMSSEFEHLIVTPERVFWFQDVISHYEILERACIADHASIFILEKRFAKVTATKTTA